MRILGIDPGFERLGIAVLDPIASGSRSGKNFSHRVVFSECFKTSSKLKFSERLVLLGKEVKKVIKKYKPGVLAIETLFLNTNQKTVMRVAEVRGVVLYEATLAKMQIFEITPLQMKMATTGYGRADKTQVIKMLKMLVEIPEGKTSDDEIDAIAIGLSTHFIAKFF